MAGAHRIAFLLLGGVPALGQGLELRDQILGFVGIRPARFSHFAGASHPKTGVVERWIAEVQRHGATAG